MLPLGAARHEEPATQATLEVAPELAGLMGASTAESPASWPPGRRAKAFALLAALCGAVAATAAVASAAPRQAPLRSALVGLSGLSSSAAKRLPSPSNLLDAVASELEERARRSAVLEIVVPYGLVNVRQQPSESSRVLGELCPCDVVTGEVLTSESGLDWVRLTSEAGYVMRNFTRAPSYTAVDADRCEDVSQNVVSSQVLCAAAGQALGARVVKLTIIDNAGLEGCYLTQDGQLLFRPAGAGGGYLPPERSGGWRPVCSRAPECEDLDFAMCLQGGTISMIPPQAPRRPVLAKQAPRKPVAPTATPRTEEAYGAVQELQCPLCAPRSTQRPDMMVPIYEKDLCKFGYLARSLHQHDPAGNIGKIFILWVSNESPAEYATQLQEAMALLRETHEAELVDWSVALGHSELAGWYAQQVVKLKIASRVSSEFYVILDSKNAFLREITADAFFSPCNQAKVQSTYAYEEVPSPHKSWFDNARDYFSVEPPPDRKWPSSTTPVVMHTQTVLDMLTWIGEDPDLFAQCTQLCDIFKVDGNGTQGATDFTSYYMWAYSKTQLECIHTIEPRSADDLSARLSVSLWRGLDSDRDSQCETNALKVASIVGGQVPLTFGAQQGSAGCVPAGMEDEVKENIAKIYQRADLSDVGTSSDYLMDCIAGDAQVAIEDE